MSAPITIEEILALSPVIPVVTLDDEHVGIEVARALMRGGIRVIEITLRTPRALQIIQGIMRAVPQMKVGAGTALSVQDLQAATRAGAAFTVSPGATSTLLAYGHQTGIPHLPAVSTASELMTAMEAGYQCLKFFPAAAAGGPELLRALQKPFPLARFCPTGGINCDNAASYLALPNVLCVGASWFTPAETLAKSDWAHVERLATAAVAMRAVAV